MKNSTKWTIGIIAVVVIAVSVIFGSTKLQKGDIRVGADNAAVVIGRITNELSKYNITVSDPDGLKSISIKNKKSATVTSGNPNNCPANKVLSSVNIKDVEFPLSVVVTDCNNKRVTVAPIPMPPVPTQPDLTVDQISVTYVPDQWLDWYAKGEQVLFLPDGKNYFYDVTVEVKNIGDAAADSAVLRIRLSDAGTAYISDVTLPSITANGSHSTTVRLSTQGKATSAFALVDKNIAIAESNENNNTKNITVPPVLLPDLIIEDITFDNIEDTETANVAQVSVNTIVKNIGDAPVSLFHVGVKVNYDSNPASWLYQFDNNFGYLDETILAAGESRILTSTLRFAEIDNNPTFTFTVDGSLNIDEHDERNNAETATKAPEPLTPPPDVDIDTNVDADIDTDDEEFLPSRLPF